MLSKEYLATARTMIAHRDRGRAGSVCRGPRHCAAKHACGGLEQSGSGGDRSGQGGLSVFRTAYSWI